LKRTISGQILVGSDAISVDMTLKKPANMQLIVTIMETESKNDKGSTTEVDKNQWWQALQVRFSATLVG